MKRRLPSVNVVDRTAFLGKHTSLPQFYSIPDIHQRPSPTRYHGLFLHISSNW